MPQGTRTVESLREKAADHMRLAEQALERTDLGEMERQIEQCQQMELAMCVLQQVAIMTGDDKLLKFSGEQATKWAVNMRGATTKRRNDIVPVLVETVTAGASWAEALRRLKDREALE